MLNAKGFISIYICVIDSLIGEAGQDTAGRKRWVIL